MSEAFPLAVAQSWRLGSQSSLETLNLFRLQANKKQSVGKTICKIPKKTHLWKKT